ncbi:unnamed protein product, partial [Prorocentrum cordatum]
RQRQRAAPRAPRWGGRPPEGGRGRRPPAARAPRPSSGACRRTPTALAPRQESAAGDAGPCRGRPGADGRRQVVGGAGPRARAPPVPPLLGRARDGGFCLPGSVVALIAGFLDRDFAAAARRPALAAA